MATDTYLALMAGREVVTHGIPRTDTLCLVSAGHVWTDEQWLAQAAMWVVDRIAGLDGVVLLQALVTSTAFGLCAWWASKRGATAAAVLIASGVGFALGAPFFTPRPQMFSLLGFAALLLLLSSPQPDTTTMPRRYWWSLPILVLWANLHGVVVIGAAFVGLRAVVELIRRRVLAIPLGLLAAATPFCTPYARSLPRYFHDIGALQSPDRRLPILEWSPVQWPGDIPFFAIFGVVAILLVVAHVKKLSRPPLFETLVLAATGLGAWQAERHLQWFGLALAAYGSALFDSLPPVREGQVLQRVTRLLTQIAPVALVVLTARLLLMSDDRLEKQYPSHVLPVLDKIAHEHPDWHIAADDRFADWVLWHVPALVGRVEYDVRFELLDTVQAREMGRFLYPESDWPRIYPDAKLVFVAREPHPKLDETAVAQPGARTIWENDIGRLVLR